MKRLLITNDDGIDAVGIKVLAETFCLDFDVMVVAPSSQRSACSHSISIHNDISFQEVERKGYKAFAITGTPADCAKIAITYLSDKPFDFVISGINNGSNLGSDTMYSGTVAAAKEAAFHNVSSIAISLTAWESSEENYASAAKFLFNNFDAFSSLNLPSNSVLNINCPEKAPYKGVKATKVGLNLYDDMFVDCDVAGVVRLQGKPIEHDNNPQDCDVEWNKKGFITVSPITLDNNDYDALKTLKKAKLEYRV